MPSDRAAYRATAEVLKLLHAAEGAANYPTAKIEQAISREYERLVKAAQNVYVPCTCGPGIVCAGCLCPGCALDAALRDTVGE
jgi:hypothetical protein